MAGVVLPAPEVMARIEALAGRLPFPVDIEELLVGRARLMGLRSRGRISAGGSCRLLPTLEGWVAVNLARPDDIETVPAIVERPDPGDPWAALAWYAAERPAAAVAARCQLLGVPGAVLADPTVDGTRAVVTRRVDDPARPPERPLVVDLSAMWAGPLCARLLGLAGMDVLKVESTTRPDGARRGNPQFYTWLHEGHDETTLDLGSSAGRDALVQLITRASVVIDSSRPRAMTQLGIDAEDLVRRQPGLTWISITGYGRTGGDPTRVAFGDDAAVAGELVNRDDDGLPVFCGDAIADPLTGLAAAVAALDSVAAGGGRLLDVSMTAVAASMAHQDGYSPPFGRNRATNASR